MVHHHFLLVSFPAQGHINPTLQLAKRLLRTGAQVTFATSVYGHQRMIKTTSHDGLSYASFSDGYDDGIKPSDKHNILEEIKRVGSQSLSDLILALSNERGPVTCLIYAVLLPWAADVARKLLIPSALLWIQPATVFAVYYHYFHGYDDLIKSNNNPSSSIELPGLPPLTNQDLPSPFLPSSPHASVLTTFQEHYQTLEQETNPRVLVNTFDALEEDAIKVVDHLNVRGIGPLIPSAFLDQIDPSDNSFGCDLFHNSNDYMQWLNSKQDSSVVYVSFGSMVVLSKRQTDEISQGLVESGRPFLWVVRSKEETQDTLVIREEGMIVEWCSQVEVLCHRSVGCFVTHCGWNSVSESLVAGVPMVGCPQWSDQMTIAKLIEDVWKTGVRARVARVEDEEGIVNSEELKRCLEIVMGGEEGEEMRRNGCKWRDLAKEAVMEGGSSDRCTRAFVEEVEQDWEKHLICHQSTN